MTSLARLRRSVSHLRLTIEALNCVDDLAVLRWRAVADGRMRDAKAGICGLMPARIASWASVALMLLLDQPCRVAIASGPHGDSPPLLLVATPSRCWRHLSVKT